MRSSKDAVAERNPACRTISMESELNTFSPKSPRTRMPTDLASIAWPRFPTRASLMPKSKSFSSVWRTMTSSSSVMTRGSTTTGVVPCSSKGSSRSKYSLITVMGT